MRLLKRATRRLINALGYELVRLDRQGGSDPLTDMQKFLISPSPVILDVGANVGQTVSRFKQALPDCRIHSFEPSPKTFASLKENTSRFADVHPWNCAVGAHSGNFTFLENSSSVMSSFLQPSDFCWGSVKRKTDVEVTTVDRFMAAEGIVGVDVLKSDTQGYELEVLKGADQALQRNKVGLVYLEIIFSKMYENLPSFDEIFQFLRTRGYCLVSIYGIRYQKNLASWTDALFVSEKYFKNAA